MADEADLADSQNAVMDKVNLYNSRKPVPDVVAIGECLFCEAPLPPGLRWCGAECRDDWQKEQDC